MNTTKFTITASQLVSLLQLLGVLVADYDANPSKPISKELAPSLQRNKSQLPRWRKELPSLDVAFRASASGGDKLSALYNLGVELKNAFPIFHNTKEYTTPELQMLKAIRAYLMTDSVPGLNFIRKNAAIFEDKALASLLTPDIPVADNRALRKTVQSLVGRDAVSLTLPEAQMLKETNPKEYAEYVALRKDHNNQFRATLMSYVRDQGKAQVPYPAAYKYLAGLGFTHSMVPGFTGLIDDQGKWYTSSGDLINGVPNLTTYSRVVMNDGKDPDEQWVFKAVKPDGNVAYGYTNEFQRKQSQSKFGRVRALMPKIKGIRAKWLAQVKAFDPTDKNSVAAVVLEILYSFAARVGSQPGRGVGTLVAKQASRTQQGINLAYLGKDSIRTKHILKSSDPIQAMVIKALDQLLEDKKGNEFIFTYVKGNRILRVTPADVNAAFRTFGAPSDVAVHKLRTVRGTFLFEQLVELDRQKRRPPANEKDAIKRYKEMTEKVGKLLNHKRGVGSSNETFTGTTAALSYIDGGAQADLFKVWGFRVPKHLEKLVQGKGDE
jgi:hypothetical protein